MTEGPERQNSMAKKGCHKNKEDCNQENRFPINNGRGAGVADLESDLVVVVRKVGMPCGSGVGSLVL